MLFKQALNFLTQDARFLFFTAALFLYALSGSPTPDNPGVLEVVIAGLLALAIGYKTPLNHVFVKPFNAASRWRLAVWMFLLYGLSAGTIFSLVNGVTYGAYLRDIIGFIFLTLPLFLIPFLNESSVRQKYFAGLILVIGLLFSLRVLLPQIFIFNPTTALLYLANSPLVLFTALYLFSIACQKLFEMFTLKRLITASFLLLLSAIPLMAMFLDIQRASFIALGVSAIFIYVTGIIKAPLKTVLPLIVLVTMAFIFQAALLNVIENVALKTSQVGFNMRLQELNAVWEALNHSPFAVLFGHGWGASFASPAVGGLYVTYTHSLLSYVFFKLGLVGLCLCMVYLFFVFEKLGRFSLRYPVKGNALMWPLLIPIFLYASHKSFDFGLLLTLVVLSGLRVQKPYSEVAV